MTATASETSFQSAPIDAAPDRHAIEADPLLILVVGRSRINTIVVSKIVERCGMKCVSASPEDGAAVLMRTSPILTILDGGSDNRDCDGLMQRLKQLRRDSVRPLPAVILLSMSNAHVVHPDHTGTIDAVVPKPILPELLQPIVSRLTAR